VADVPTAGGPAVPPPTPTGDEPDPQFWGAEPRPVRRARRAPPPRPTPTDRFGALTDSWRDRLGDTRVEVGIGVIAVVVVALVAGVVWYRMGASGNAAPPRRPVSSESRADAPATGAHTAATASRAAGSTRTAIGATVTVHVAGAVKTPGVIALPVGARVIDAVEGAGGGLPDADLDHLTLAAKLVDGQRVLVTKIGHTAPVGVGDPTAGTSEAGSGALIDLNNATSAQLETLPGIGPALAGAIIAERDRRGGFRSVNELREVRGIGERRFADLKSAVTV
jgi:competence protein ComEA